MWQDSVKREHVFRIDVQTPDRVKKPRSFGFHLSRVRFAKFIRTRNRKIVLLKPRVAWLTGCGVVQQMVGEYVISIVLSGRTRERNPLDDQARGALPLLDPSLWPEVFKIQFVLAVVAIKLTFAEATLGFSLESDENTLDLAPDRIFFFVSPFLAEDIGSVPSPLPPARLVPVDQGLKAAEADVVPDHDFRPDSSAISVRAASESPWRVFSSNPRIRRVCFPERVDSRPNSSVSKI